MTRAILAGLISGILAAMLGAMCYAAAPARFGVSDATELADGLRAWLVHDRKRPDQCVLVVHLGSSLTSQPWRCD